MKEINDLLKASEGEGGMMMKRRGIYPQEVIIVSILSK